MPIDYSKAFDMMKDKGLSTYRIRKDKIISEYALQSLRNKKSVTVETIEKLCAALECQPGDLMTYIPEKEKEGSE